MPWSGRPGVFDPAAALHCRFGVPSFRRSSPRDGRRVARRPDRRVRRRTRHPSIDQAALLRRRAIPMPASARPISARLAGAGTWPVTTAILFWIALAYSVALSTAM